MVHPHTPLRIPESMSAAEIGAFMARLREQFKLTTLDVSDRLHIRVRYVQAIEEGRYDLMPGPVYARGYIHTYAEFLGLDADQVATECFRAQSIPVNQVTFTPPSAPSKKMSAANLRGIGIASVMAAVVLLIVTQITGAENEVEKTARNTVAPVPEAMLKIVRTNAMPLAQNYDCLTGDTTLDCFFADATVKEMMRLQRETDLPFLDEASLLSATVPLSDATEAPAEHHE